MTPDRTPTGRPDERTHVVVLGAGYLAIWSARALVRHGRGRLRVTVVAPSPVHAFHGWTGEVISGELPTTAPHSPIAEALPRATHVRGKAVRVDREARTVEVELTDGGSTRLEYDQLVVGVGAQEKVDLVPGMAEHAFTLREAIRAGRLVEHLDERVAQARAVPAGERADGALDVVVVGGGLAGAETAIAIAQRLERNGARTEGGRVRVVSASETIGREFSPALRARLVAALTANGIEVLAPARVVRVAADGVELSDGTWIAATTTVATVGNRAVSVPGLDDLPRSEQGRLVVDDTFRAAPRVWAGGDAAEIPLPSGEPCPKDAAWAIGQGSWLGRNVALVLAGRDPRPFTWRSVGVTAGLGGGEALLDAWGMPFHGRMAWMSRAMFFGSYLPSRRQLGRVLNGLVRSRTRRARPAVGAATPDTARSGR
ncbi:NAD(P)/FAD-dependent oxidoreductase [Pseudonocardia sp. HH130630-07]|uniref:NAD(P)/FAD-dependent oxidoreductase n=1 Tax=Pseudonocardia sp. HH130630-07 TaxID=1690815 RepID=UPI000814C67E|nr:FAD-dependent oxidoreductase [Pseudonocardia sp. HH130630-07]ANY09428.1 hypothetical protein AFB00_27885 [Pseudonocardia sp. HH130630-07]